MATVRVARIAVAAAVALIALRADAAEFIGVGDLEGGGVASYATDLSDDGMVVVGRSGSGNGSEAFRWTSSGMEPLGDFPDGDFFSAAHAVSADGGVVVGFGTTANGKEAFRLGAGQTIPGNGLGTAGYPESVANDVSADGSAIAGTLMTQWPGNAVMRWEQAAGIVPLSSVNGVGHGISRDGHTIVGSSATTCPSGCNQVAGRWIDFGSLEVLSTGSYRAQAANENGTIIAGGTTVWYEFIKLYYKLLPLFTHFIESPEHRHELLRLLQGDVYDRDEVAVLDAMREYIRDVESTEGHLLARHLDDTISVD